MRKPVNLFERVKKNQQTKLEDNEKISKFI